MRLFEYGQVLTLLIVFILLLMVTDAGSRYLRIRGTKGLAIERRVQADNVVAVQKYSSSASRNIFVWLALLAVVVTSFVMAGLTPSALTDAGVATRMASFVLRMLPPDLSRDFLGSLRVALLQTIAISVMGTLVGVALAVVLAVPATSTLILVRGDSPGRNRLADRLLRWFFFWGARLMLNILRSIPELVWVLILVLAVGVGPFAGTIALGMHTAGVLGKLYAETMEEVPARPVEALNSLGARPLQMLVWAIWPQARPMLSSYTVLRWEMNLRASTILGLVGGGGLGQAIYNNVQLGFYSRLSTLILLIYALVLASDWISERVRVSIA
jgi:phosphonate transport system permease protein